MRSVGLIIVLAIAIISIAVAVVVAAFQNGNEIQEISFSRSGCFGQCPAYEVTFRSNGCAAYVGHSNTLLIGRYTGLVPFRNLAQLVDAHHFWDLQGRYGMNVADAPGMKLTVVKPLNSKTVETHDSSDVPPDLYALGKIIDGFVFTTHWVSTDPRQRKSDQAARYVPASCV